MEEAKLAKDWKYEVTPALISKKEEFHLLGYTKTTVDDIWKCLEAKTWKKTNHEPKRLYAVVADVMHLSISDYMSYLTMSVYKEDDDLMASIAALSGNQPAE